MSSRFFGENVRACVTKKLCCQGKAQGQHGLCNSCCWCKKQLRCHLSCDARVNVMNQYAAHLLQNWKDRQFDSALHAMACQTRQAMIAGTDVAAIQQSVIELVRGKVMLVTYCNMLLFCFNVVIGSTHCHQTLRYC